MNPKDILETAKKIIQEMNDYDKDDKDSKKRDLMVKYEDFSLRYPVIFLSAVNGTLELKQFEQMIDMATKVENNDLTKHEASVKIGTTLVDEFVKPMINSKK
jgi:hypothetical protein